MALPSGYTQLEYIRATGKQWIDTGFKPDYNTRVRMTATIEKSSSSYPVPFGTWDKTETNAFILLLFSNGRARLYYGNKTTDSSKTIDENIHVFDVNKNVLLIDDELYITSATNTFSCSYNLYLFQHSAANGAIGGSQNAPTGNIYNCKIWDNDILVRDFVPCIDTSGNVGLYDSLTKQFYQSITSSSFEAGTIVVNNLKKGDILNYSYTGSDQSIVLPAGQYKLEVWGAQGGSYSSYQGGAGGYSIGTLTLTEDTLLHMFVGQQAPTVSTLRAVVPGGYNGGGNGYNRYYSSTYTYGQGGGGGTDIRIGSNSLYARVIVAGGGGGSASVDALATKYGGGENGGSPSAGYAGTQTTGGSKGTKGAFGQGANVTTKGSNYKYSSGGGGGGWYGGAADSGYADSPSTRQNYNGGGSGYVYTSSTATNYPSGCLLNDKYYLINAKTYAGNTSFPSTDGSAETGHKGNGHARITVLKIDGSLNLPVNIDGSWKDSDSIYVNIDGVWKNVEAAFVNIDGTWKELG